jgi:hypothetical protein
MLKFMLELAMTNGIQFCRSVQHAFARLSLKSNGARPVTLSDDGELFAILAASRSAKSRLFFRALEVVNGSTARN